MVDGTLYVSTPLGRVIALDPARGRERWRYDPRVDLHGDYGDFANRGVSTWLVHMTQLRHKLERDPTQPRYFLTEPGVGYRLRAD
jgi:quinoprotein glucose dehydrogenase